MSEQEVSISPAVVEFIRHLDKSYPARCIARGEDLISANRYAAVREFIDELVAIADDYEEGDHENTRDNSG